MRSQNRSSGLRARAGALALAAGLAAAAHAEDIDIYAGTNTNATLPNVLYLLDNTSNWSANSQQWVASGVWATERANATAACTSGGSLDQACYDAAVAQAQTLISAVFYHGPDAAKRRPWQSGFAGSDDVSLKQGQIELRTLRLVITTNICKPSGAVRIKIGLMLLSDAGTARSTGDPAAYIRRAVQLLSTEPRTDAGGNLRPSTCDEVIADLTTIDERITQPDFKASSKADYGTALFEAFKYFGGHSHPGRQAAGSPVGALGYGPVRFSRSTTYEDPGAFQDPQTRTTYKSPIGSAGCSRNFIVLVGNGYPNAEPAGPASFQGLGYTPPALTEDPGRYADEWAEFLYNTDVSPAPEKQEVATYAINVFNDKPSAAQRVLMRSIAEHGGGEYVEVGGSLRDLFKAFNDLLLRMASVDSVFTATTLPVSTTTQGTYLNQLFIGMFRPDGDGGARWIGNLKQYRLGMHENGDLQVVDAQGAPAITGGTGFFSPLAVSYWSRPSVFFENRKMGTPESSSDSPDGPVVEKGGVAQRLRDANLSDASGRNVFTLPAGPASDTALSDWPFTSATVGGTFTAEEVSWIRGENNVASGAGREYNGAVPDPSTGLPVDLGITGPRPSIHGDVLHSRPVAVNYGNGNVIVFYGSNDGMLRAVDGNLTGDSAGQELWSFVAPEHYGMLRRQRSATPALYLPSTNDLGNAAVQLDGTAKKDYGFDGPIGLFARYSSTTGNLIEGAIYAAMRRGGRGVYAFDVGDPRAPRFLWKVTHLTAGFSNLGQTWSMPRPVIFPPAYSVDPYIIMGGGYDPAEDRNESTGLGRSVYVINARTGHLVRHLSASDGIEWSVPGDITVVDTNADKIFDRAYFADVRGNLYRLNMASSTGALLPVASWSIKKIASLGGKVFSAPDVVVTRHFIAVLTGTGDREKPLLLSTRDRFFLIKDTLLSQPDRTEPLLRTDLTRIARVDEDRPDEVVLKEVVTNVSNPNGCYFTLATTGEKVVNTPFTIAGATYFGTNRPTPDSLSCTGTRGQARSYTFPLFCGVPRGVVLEGGGIPPSPVGGLVNITASDGSETLVPFVIGSGAGRSPFEAERPRPPITPSRKRNYWQINDGNR